VTLEVWESELSGFKKNLTQIRERAATNSQVLSLTRKQAEVAKVTILIKVLESRRKTIAAGRGLRAFWKDGIGLGPVLLESGIGFVGTALITHNKNGAFSAGLGVAHQGVQARGEVDWVVNISTFSIIPESEMPTGPGWVKWPGLFAALHLLKNRAENGVPLGDLNNITESLMETKLLKFIRRFLTGTTNLIIP